MKLNMPVLVSVCLVALFVTLIPSFANAVTVTPLLLELNADPGQTAAGSFTVSNDALVPETYYIKFARFEADDDESGQPKFIPGREGLPSWTTVIESVTIPGKERQKIDFTITPPLDAEPGGYFAAIFASTVPPNSEDTGTVSLESNVGTLILFRVNGDFSEGEAILEFDTKDKKRLFRQLPVDFYFRFQNSGADKIQPLGDVTIKNMIGRTSKIVTANRQGGNILPQSIRRFETSWFEGSNGPEIQDNKLEPEMAPANQSFLQAVAWQWNHFALGRYTAELNLTVNNDSGRHYTKNVNFWIIPWQLLLVVLIILLIIFRPRPRTIKKLFGRKRKATNSSATA